MIAAAGLAASLPPAAAQESGPLRFLRPSLRGEQPPTAAPAPVAPSGQPETPSASEAPVREPPREEAVPEPAPPEPAPTPALTNSGSLAPAEPISELPAEAEDAHEAGEDAPAAEEAEPEPSILRLGVIAGPDVMATMTAIEPMREDLRQILGRAVQFLPVSSYDAMIDAQMQLRIDGGFYSAGAFAVAEAQCNCLEPIVAPAAADGTLAYHAIIVARSDSGLASAADLDGRIVATGAADSIGGRRMQLASLLAEGVDPSRFGALRAVASPEEAVLMVAEGAVDAAFAWSSLSGDMSTGYSRGTFTDLVARGAISMSDIAVIWRSPALAHGPFAVISSLAEEEKRKIEAYLLTLSDTVPAAYDRLSPYYGGGYVAVEPGDYDSLQVLAGEDVDAIQWSVAVPESGDPVGSPKGEPAQ
jgi:phosphonate transport system substrate-binding protein